jgi:hypothetical protein
MNPEYDYGTVTEAINAFRADGFELDFNLEENHLSCSQGKFKPEELEIVKVFRYEGDSDPGDEAVVYAIESKQGLKGILVAGFGASSDAESAKTLAKLKMRS